eukprot:COSAG06_NODE_883_length_11788_cov_4.031568_11_plen_49_part_00
MLVNLEVAIKDTHSFMTTPILGIGASSWRHVVADRPEIDALHTIRGNV